MATLTSKFGSCATRGKIGVEMQDATPWQVQRL